MSIAPVGSFRSFVFPNEDGYNSDLAEENPVLINDLDSDDSDASDVSVNSDIESEASDTDSEEQVEMDEQAERACVVPSFFGRIKDKISTNAVIIGLAAISIGSAIIYRGLPSESQAQEAGVIHGRLEGDALTSSAIKYVESHVGENLSSIFTAYVTQFFKQK